MKRVIETRDAPAAIASYSQAIVYYTHTGKLLFTAGQIGLDPSTGKLVSGGIEAQTVRVMENINAILEAAFTSFERVLKTTIYLVDLEDYATVNEIYARYFGPKLPARATVQVAALPMGALIEIECIAAVS